MDFKFDPGVKGRFMIQLDSFKGIYLHRGFVDFRKSINGLSVIVEEEMGLDVFGLFLFIFCNRGRNRLKVLYWDESGFALWYKRLEEDKFKWPRKMDDEVIEVNEQELRWLLSGYDFWKMTPHKKLQYKQVS